MKPEVPIFQGLVFTALILLGISGMCLVQKTAWALTVTPGSVTIFSGESATLVLAEGSGYYRVTSSDEDAVTVSYAGDEIKVTGITKGTATITVKDDNDTIFVPVVVDPPMAVVPDTVHVPEGKSRQVVIDYGEPPFTVTSSPVVNVVRDSRSLTITGVTAGTAEVVVTDAVSDSVTIDVVVYRPLSVNAKQIRLARNTRRTFEVAQGIAPYTAMSLDESIAAVSMNGSTLAVESKSIGRTTITVSDSAVSPNVIVLDTDISEFNVSTIDIQVQQGHEETVEILGTGLFNVGVSDPDVVSAAISGSSVLVSGLGEGNAVVSIGSSTGLSFDIAVMVYEELGVSRTSVEMVAGTREKLQIFGGVWPYALVSADPDIADVPATWGVVPFEVAGIGPGQTMLAITDAVGAGAAVTVTVLRAGLEFKEQTVFMSPGAEKNVPIIGGTGYYTVASADPGVAGVSLGTDSVVVLGIATGKTRITVQDSSTDSAELAVWVLLHAPVLDLDITGTRVQLAWHSVPGADRYVLYYALPDADGNPEPEEIHQLDLGRITGLEVDLGSGTRVFAAVQAVDNQAPDLASVISNVVEIVIP